MQFHYIYITTNNIDGKRYIGKRTYTGTDIKNDTYLGSGKYFKNAVKKYGRKNFTKVILQVCETEDEVYEAETWWVYISNANHLDAFYNIACGGKGGQAGRKDTDETRKKKSDSMKGRMAGEKHPMYGKKQSAEANKKRSDAEKGEKNPMYGKRHSDETKKKIGAKSKGRKFSIEARMKMSESERGEKNHNYGKHPSEETINKNRLSQPNIKKVVRIDIKTNDVTKVYDSVRSVNVDGYFHQNVLACCNNKKKTSGGYKWMYLDEYNKINNKE